MIQKKIIRVYDTEKNNKGISNEWLFVCSIHNNELLGIVKKVGTKCIFDISKEIDVKTQYHDGINFEILRYNALSDDSKGTLEFKPIYRFSKNQRPVLSIGTAIKIKKFATDVLGNLYEVKDNVLKLEFD